MKSYSLLFSLLFTTLIACGGEEKKPEAKPEVKTEAKAAPTPAPTPVATPAPTPAAPPASGPYTPDDLAKAAYEAAKAAKADAVTKNPKSGDAAALAAGKTHYDTKCASCHGATGMGDGMVGAALPQKPANFAWKERWDATSMGTKHWILLNGVQGTAMAPLGLTPDQAWEVLAYIELSFAPKAAK